MASSNSPLLHPRFSLKTLILYILFVSASSDHITDPEDCGIERTKNSIGRRSLMSFKETPGGGNATYECSPSGPCVYCRYPEKKDEKYRCSETGYRIPLACVAIGIASKEEKSKQSENNRSTLENLYNKVKSLVTLHGSEVATSTRNRRLADDSSSAEGNSFAYITYRSCIPPVDEEKLSLLGFEGIVFGFLLVSGSFTYLRRRRTTSNMPGFGGIRLQSNSRF